RTPGVFIHLEGWYTINIWSIMIDKAFLKVQDIELVRGDSASVASGNRKKNNRNKAEKGTSGRRPDGIFKSTVNNHEYGGIENMFDQLSSVVNHNEAVAKEIEVIGLLHSRLQLQQLLVDYGGGSCLRLIKEATTNVPVLRAKLRVQRCIAVLKDDSEDASFLREITQPSSCPSTPPNEQAGYLTTSRTVTCPTFKSPEKATKVEER
ncbi:13824_t:CDS:2, partial [Ambispora leptoticha]